jgi:DNA-directed RNA polymerase specialized sigma24 family protein
VTTAPPQLPSDLGLSKRIRAGDRDAVRAVLARDHPVAVLFASALADEGSDPGPLVEDAWAGWLEDVAEGKVEERLRAALLVRVAAGLQIKPRPDEAYQPEQLGTFTATGDRWEGWWDRPPATWPPDVVPQPDHVVAAVRDLPAGLRAILVLRDVAELSAEEVADIVPEARYMQDTALEQARDGYLVELDRVMGGPRS